MPVMTLDEGCGYTTGTGKAPVADPAACSLRTVATRAKWWVLRDFRYVLTLWKQTYAPRGQ